MMQPLIETKDCVYEENKSEYWVFECRLFIVTRLVEVEIQGARDTQFEAGWCAELERWGQMLPNRGVSMVPVLQVLKSVESDCSESRCRGGHTKLFCFDSM